MMKKKQDVKRNNRQPKVSCADRKVTNAVLTKANRSAAARDLESTSALPRNARETVPFQASLKRHLSKVEEVEAVFARIDEDNVCRVFSVVREHKAETYVKAMRAERRIQKEFPEVQFDFRIRAHQGRNPYEAVPVTTRALFLR